MSCSCSGLRFKSCGDWLDFVFGVWLHSGACSGTHFKPWSIHDKYRSCTQFKPWSIHAMCTSCTSMQCMYGHNDILCTNAGQPEPSRDVALCTVHVRRRRMAMQLLITKGRQHCEQCNHHVLSETVGHVKHHCHASPAD